MSYQEYFPDFELDVQVPPGFIDDSQRNDACPHWIYPDLNLALWINYPEWDAREDKNRFYLYETDSDGLHKNTILVAQDGQYDMILLAILEHMLLAHQTRKG